MSDCIRKVILVTDGDSIAQKTVETAVANIGGRCISATGGNPTPLDGQEVVRLIKAARNDPVVVMVDDRGSCHKGKGEKVLEYVAQHPDIEVIGILAVASNTESIEGAVVDCAVTKRQEVVEGQVDKTGEVISAEKMIKGDTVDVINELDGKVAFVVGVGDIGKMDGKDDPHKGARVTTRALNLIMEHYNNTQGG